jgi:hypothetical protein
MKTALISTVPNSLRKQGTINYGLELAADRLGADVYHFNDNKQNYLQGRREVNYREMEMIEC